MLCNASCKLGVIKRQFKPKNKRQKSKNVATWDFLELEYIEA